jgi:hypothetical protein
MNSLATARLQRPTYDSYLGPLAQISGVPIARSYPGMSFLSTLAPSTVAEGETSYGMRRAAGHLHRCFEAELDALTGRRTTGSCARSRER